MKKNNIDKLYESILTVAEITCSKCNKTTYLPDADDYTASEEFDSMGWYATEMNVYCPNCNTKRKKKK